MRKALAVSLVLYLAVSAPLFETITRAANSPAAFAMQQGEASDWFSPEQLDNLLAPIALYPDPLLAQVLVAATFPSQIDEATRFLRANADPKAIDGQPWDVSVKAVAHYPTVLYMMADNLDWTTSMGQAYVNQSTDVMTSVQRLRAQARAAGTLVTTPQMEVVVDAGYIEIWPAQPQLIYVPAYDPAFVFVQSLGFWPGAVISFGVGFAIGAWLNYDCDWHRHRLYYHGWEHGGGWVNRSRPYVHITNIYVNNRYTNVAINRTVVNRRVNYNNLNRYNTVHRQVTYDNVNVNRRDFGSRGERGAAGGSREAPNKIIRRNIDLNDSRIEANRGQVPERRMEQPAPQRQQPTPQRQQPAPQRQQPALQRQVQPRDYSVFRGQHTVIEPHAASQRGQASRQQAQRSAPTAKPPVPPAHPPAHREDGGQRSRGERQP